MKNEKLWKVALVVIGIIAIIGLFTPAGQKIVKGFGSTTQVLPSCGGSVTCFTDLFVSNSITSSLSQLTSNGGVVATQVVRQSLTSGTSTPCSIQNPFTSTSTLVSFVYNLTTGTSTPANGVNLIVGTTTTSAFATSTSLVNSQYLAAGTLGTVTWNPGTNNGAIAPLAWVNVGYLASSTITVGGIITSGTCQAVFQSAN